MTNAAHELTPAQLALAEKRRLKKLNATATEVQKPKSDPRGAILPREWVSVPVSEGTATSKDNRLPVKVMTWNLLAQCLVRRELFPRSDCLKASQREHMLYNEILSHNPDICCLQEVDRTEKLFPVLENAGYAHVYAAGPRKKHGCAIVYRKTMFEHIAAKAIAYDEEEVRSSSRESDGQPVSKSGSEEESKEAENRRRRASTRITKNIANLVALRRLGPGNAESGTSDGVVVGTTHLFWHPRFTYERVRQTAILFREVSRFREDAGHLSWPCIVAGDFNFTPADPAYAFLTGDPLLPIQAQALEDSRVIHMSLDPSIPYEVPTTIQEEAEEESGGGGEQQQDPDRVITNSRKALKNDGLLNDEELGSLFMSEHGVSGNGRVERLFSAYDRGMGEVLRVAGRNESATELRSLTVGSRDPVLPGRHGGNEPVWTSYTEYWKTVLDYIFVLDSPQQPVSVLALAKPHTADKVDPGLPLKGVCGSDHISLAAELSWPSVNIDRTVP